MINENFLILIFFLMVFKFTPRSFIGDQWANTITEIFIFLSLIVMGFVNMKFRYNLNKVAWMLLTLIFLSQLLWIRLYFGFQIDVKEQFNWLLYFLLYVVIVNILKNNNLDKKRIFNCFSLIIILNIAISLLSYMNESLFNIFNVLFETSKTAIIGSTYQRFSGTFSNPNFFGVFFSVIGSFVIIKLLNEKKKKISHLLYLFVIIYLINISGSRSALISFVFLSVLVLFISFFLNEKKSISLKNLSIFFLIIASVFLTSFLLTTNLDTLTFSNLNTRFFNYENIKVNFVGRINMTQGALDFFVKNPLMGVGPENDAYSSIDNQYGKLLMESGVLVFLLFLILLFYLLITRFRLFREEKDDLEKKVYFFTFITTVALIINMFGAAIFSVTQLTSLYFFLLALNKR
ncbi:O-antigen ligase family protein [Paenibacillus sp. FSL H3-0469]|uniref:O-antigen ligase family protein n=1 Tax=Paenibacillus sp. FSL H3-0469 TaxID=2954506 RepID=UPI003101118F